MDLMATSGEYLRLFQIGNDSKSVAEKCKLVNVRFFLINYFILFQFI
jgi:hypothetical protein